MGQEIRQADFKCHGVISNESDPESVVQPIRGIGFRDGVPYPLSQNRGVEPIERYGGIRGLIANFVDESFNTLIVVDKDEAFFTFD
jgi:hypothetical protein